MHLRPLGSSGLLVSPVCLGTMTFGTPVGEVDAIRLTHAAIDLGINFIDTANVYEGYARYLGSPGGVAEEIVGKALRDRRDRVIASVRILNREEQRESDRAKEGLQEVLNTLLTSARSTGPDLCQTNRFAANPLNLR